MGPASKKERGAGRERGGEKKESQDRGGRGKEDFIQRLFPIGEMGVRGTATPDTSAVSGTER